MTIIVGVLIIVGLLAIIGAVLLLQGGGNDQSTQAAPPQPAVASTTKSEQPGAPLPVPVAPEVMNNVPMESQSLDDELQAAEQKSPVEQEEEQHVVLNGQFHELVDQLRTLHDQSVEIEQRLNALNEMVEHIGQR